MPFLPDIGGLLATLLTLLTPGGITVGSTIGLPGGSVDFGFPSGSVDIGLGS